MTIPELETERLYLRAWRESDLDAFAAILGDPDVAQFLGGVKNRADAWRIMAGHLGHWQLRGYGFWAVERKSDGALVGRVGLHYPEGWPGLEVGWTLGRAFWGQGYATEAAAASLSHGFATQPVARLISCIDAGNASSQAVARRLGQEKGEAATLTIGGSTYPVDIWSVSRDAWGRAHA
jgi:RimJ/RimL family protein N-acetyltransferase